MNQPFSENLRLLCSHVGSISEVCRRIGINRTQFNKYLNGQVIPSARNLKQICDFFGVENHEILGPSEDFRKIITIGNNSRTVAQDSFFSRLQAISSASNESLRQYCGYYFEYYFSLGFPGKILKSLVHIYPLKGQLAYKRIERLASFGTTGRASKCKYEGRVLLLADRITLMDLEQLTGNEITQTILYRAYFNKIDYLSGIKLGISARGSREPAATRVLYHYQGPTASVRQLFKSCGIYEPDSLLIGDHIKERIANSKDDKEPLFLARL